MKTLSRLCTFLLLVIQATGIYSQDDSCLSMIPEAVVTEAENDQAKEFMDQYYTDYYSTKKWNLLDVNGVAIKICLPSSVYKSSGQYIIQSYPSSMTSDDLLKIQINSDDSLLSNKIKFLKDGFLKQKEESKSLLIPLRLKLDDKYLIEVLMKHQIIGILSLYQYIENLEKKR